LRRRAAEGGGKGNEYYGFQAQYCCKKGEKIILEEII